MDEETKQQLKPVKKSSGYPKFYGQLQIREKWTSLRPTVNSRGWLLQQLAKFLAKQLQTLSEDTESYVKKASCFIFNELLKKEEIKPVDLLVIFDVVSLLTNVATEET